MKLPLGKTLGLLGGIILFGLAGLLGLRLIMQKSTADTAAKLTPPSEPVALPDNVFDATDEIDGVRVSYPKNGFYGWGIKPGFDDSGIRYLRYVSPGTAGSGPLVAFTVYASKPKKGETLRAMTQDARKTTLKNGNFITINGHEYFVFKQPPQSADSDEWIALSHGKQADVRVIFDFYDYPAASTAFTKAAYRNDDQLFFQILSHLQFE